jgi:RimJ/RimL family protein N-acetyltransferase
MKKPVIIDSRKAEGRAVLNLARGTFVLETKRLILREMTMNDLSATRAIVCDEQTMYAWNGAWSESDNLEALQKQMRGYQEDGFGRWAVALKETNVVVGICGLQWCDTDKDEVLEIGYLFNRAYWHKGYASESAIACKEYAFGVLKYDEVFSLIRDNNFASMNVAIRSGMLVRGRYTKHYKGEDMPHYIFSARESDEYCVKTMEAGKV